MCLEIIEHSQKLNVYMFKRDTQNFSITLYVVVFLGEFFLPVAYTLNNILTNNGSNSSGRCPLTCIMEESDICECTNGSTTGVLFDNNVPDIDTTKTEWASGVYTIHTSNSEVDIGFKFQQPIALQVIKLNIFFCTAWSIPTGGIDIMVLHGQLFPNTVGASVIGNISLNRDLQNCYSFITVFVNISIVVNSTNYFIKFSGPTPLGRIYIGEVKFSDDIIKISGEPSKPKDNKTSEWFSLK